MCPDGSSRGLSWRHTDLLGTTSAEAMVLMALEQSPREGDPQLGHSVEASCVQINSNMLDARVGECTGAQGAQVLAVGWESLGQSGW